MDPYIRERVMRMKEKESKMRQQTDTYQDKPFQNVTDYFTGDFTLDLELVKKEVSYNSDAHFREFNIGGQIFERRLFLWKDCRIRISLICIF